MIIKLSYTLVIYYKTCKPYDMATFDNKLAVIKYAQNWDKNIIITLILRHIHGVTLQMCAGDKAVCLSLGHEYIL